VVMCSGRRRHRRCAARWYHVDRACCVLPCFCRIFRRNVRRSRGTAV